MADADAPKAPASLLAELQGDKRASLSHVHTREESGLDQVCVATVPHGRAMPAQWAAMQQVRILRGGCAAAAQRLPEVAAQLTHPARTCVLLHSHFSQAKVLSAIKGDHKRRLSHVATAEKNKLPTKEVCAPTRCTWLDSLAAHGTGCA